MSPRVLVVDLNNFSRFPTLPVGLMTGLLRSKGSTVEVLSPFAVGVPGLQRASRAKPWGYWDERLRWWSATTRSRTVRAARGALDRLRPHQIGARSDRMIASLDDALDRRPEVVVISTYLMYFDVVRVICARCAERGIPTVVGGPAFHGEATRAAWLTIPGLSGLFAGEAEVGLMDSIAAILHGGTSPAGLSMPGKADGGTAAPLMDLDAQPFPDYSDFPWERYPNRIVSMLTGRGCGWGVCRFCSDVVTVSGRGFRTRSIGNVLDELRHHKDAHETSLFCFSDLKLNSNLEVWRGLHERMQGTVPGANWTCAVHVGPRKDEGLGSDDLRAAAAAGLRRITAGFETASPRLLDAMRKGSRPERIAEFLAHATEAGISTRLTAFTGYPGEEPSDVDATTRFLEQSSHHIERVHLSRLSIQAGTPLDEDMRSGALSGSGIEKLAEQTEMGMIAHVSHPSRSLAHRRAIARLLRAVHRINRRPIRFEAQELEGAM